MKVTPVLPTAKKPDRRPHKAVIHQQDNTPVEMTYGPEFAKEVAWINANEQLAQKYAVEHRANGRLLDEVC